MIKCIEHYVLVIVIGGFFALSAYVSGDVVEVGPYVQFTGSHSAIVRWDTDTARDSIVEYGTSPDALNLRVENSDLITSHELTINGLRWRTKYYYRVGYSDGEGETFTEIYWPQTHQSGRECGFDNNINYTRLNCSSVASPYPTDSLTPLYEQAADRIIAQTGIQKGYCLVYGCGEGRLAFELAKRTDMMIVGVDEDSAKINTAVEKLMEAGVYGSRVTLRHISSLSDLPFTKYFANLIVSDRIISDGQLPGSAIEMFRLLRPSGGIAYIGQPEDCPSEITQTQLEAWLGAASFANTIDDTSGLWAKVEREPVAGGGWWSHQYGGCENNGSSNDDLEGAVGTGDMQVQWLGWPGPDSGLDRNSRMPAPVAQNGRLFHQGLNRIIAMDSYNGAVYWSLEIPYLRRINIPRDSSNVCCDDDYLYVAVQDDCWRLDGDTGIRSLTYKLGDSGYDWGCVMRSGDKFYGSAVKAGSFYTNYWTADGWYDNPAAGHGHKICSDYIFANDVATGNRVWTYNTGVIINTTIAIGNGRLYFVESRDPTVKSYSSGRIGLSALWNNQYLVALNSETGSVLWEKPINTVDGTVVFYMFYADEALVLGCSGESDQKNRLYVFDATNGNPKWGASYPWSQDHHGQHMLRAVVAKGNVYLLPRGYNLNTGSVVTSGMPTLLGCCGTIGATSGVIYGRTGEVPNTIAMWNIDTETSTYWKTLRPSCWLSVISGGGMMLAPEGGGGCSCGWWLSTSVGFTASGD